MSHSGLARRLFNITTNYITVAELNFLHTGGLIFVQSIYPSALARASEEKRSADIMLLYNHLTASLPIPKACLMVTFYTVLNVI